MPYYDKNEISELELALVWQYVDKLNKDKKLSTAKQLYSFHCGNCHGQDARGGATQVDLVESSEDFRVWIRKGAAITKPESHYKYMPRWNSMELSNEEIEIIESFVYGLTL